MSSWYWRVIFLQAVFIFTCLVSQLRCDDNIQKLPFCNPQNSDVSSKIDLVIVSTLDGRLTAFSTHDGTKAWHLDTKPLLSSNLHHVELTSGGKWVRLVPSLRGTLYSVSGDSIEPLPFDAEQLLSSSFKYSEDLVIAGAHESSWLGVDAWSGSVVYECGAGECRGEETAAAGRELLILRRHGNTLRALDPRTGTQKWNFSVAEHQLVLSSSRECLGERAEPSTAAAFAVALPEGIVAVRQPDSHLTIWQQKLESPVANMWRLHGGSLQNIDVLWESTRILDGSVQSTPPSLYIGVHNTQLYIQESRLYAQQNVETSLSANPRKWKLQHSRPLIAGGNDETALSQPDADPNTLSLITLYGKTGQLGDHGFFLYLKDTCDESVQVPEIDDIPDTILPNDSDSHQHIHVHVYSLWFWWKEVLLIAISSALLMNLMIWPRYIAPKFRPVSPLPINQEYIVVERHYERAPPTPAAIEYSGRYENDFTPLRCLGRGGFGVVFEAKNNIDHCSYAVKRITLPRRQSKRERVLREVRALAKLEHEHIVRYFNAWLEEPPLHWQEQRDATWMRELESGSKAEYTPSSPVKTPTKDDSVKLNLQKAIDDCVDALEYEKQLTVPTKRYRSRSCNDSFIIVFDENASKPPETTQSKSSKHSTNTSDVTTPNYLSKHDLTLPTSTSKNLGSGDGGHDDSFIVFANTHDQVSEGLSEARNDASYNKRLEKVKKCESIVKADGSSSGKKKKGHTRHWSLDLCVRDNTGGVATNEVGGAKRASGPGTKMYLYIQMQLCRPDSLHDWLRNNRTVQVRAEKVKSLFSQIVSAVEYVHLAGLIHRDLKPSNIFFAPDGKVKVGDFGLVTTMSDKSQDGDSGTEVNEFSGHTHRVGTHLYMSPEQLLGRPYSYKVDIYSLGVILFELLQPFETESERIACLLRLRNAHYPQHFQQTYPHETEVLKLMLSEDPSQRPTASGVRARAPLYQYTDEQWHFHLPSTMVTA